MGTNNQLDMEIIKDIDNCMGEKETANDANFQAHSDGVNTVSFVEGKESWSCPVCGYLYEGALPEEFICPRCEQPSTVFVRNHIGLRERES